MICAINDSLMMAGAASAYARQATAFDTAANVYAPYYRQDNSSPDNRLNVIAGTPTSDATAAFDYYIKHFNQGRPFILAGHSQGANIVCNLLSGYLKANPQVYSRMIAAYVIGGPVTKAFLAANPHLKFATGPDDVGVIISYNTEANDITGVNPVIYGEVGLVINPITWTRGETLADTSQGLGSLFPNKTGVWGRIPQYADARVDTVKGVLICTTANEDRIAIIDSLSGFPKGVYHSFDYPFYYYNIRQNAANRIQKFLSK
jgi:pimeloyl-ACP methyl ester carboxylesterase